MGIYETLEHGQGTPAVMLHGLMGDPANWQGVFPFLPKTCRAVSLRFPFFRDAHELESIAAVADYAQHYLEDAGFERVVLVGNSLGGHVALALALRIPERVSGMVLTGSGGLLERGFSTMQGSHPPREWVRQRILEIFHDPAHATDALVNWVWDTIANRANTRYLVRIAKSAKRDNVGARLGEIACPVLLVWGRQDRITPSDVAMEFHRRLVRSELEWLDECGHAAMMEHPRQFAEILGRWWDRHICPQGEPSRDGVVS